MKNGPVSLPPLVYEVVDFTTEEAAKAAALSAAKNGKQPANLTFAVNDGVTHSLETVREVWSKLDAARGNANRVENALRKLGERFMKGERVGH